MKKTTISTILILLILAIVVFIYWNNQQQSQKSKDTNDITIQNTAGISPKSVSPNDIEATQIAGLEIPQANPNDHIVSHTGYSLLYNETHEQASWVAYELTREETKKIASRTDKFLPDPKVITGTAINKDYSGSGYDRGHLAPAADMGWSEISMAESFYFSNMSPQAPGFNRGIWKNLEEQVRSWAIENEVVYVVTGPVLTKNLPAIGKTRVSVPKFYYKVILDYKNPGIKGIGFIMPNSSSNQPLQHYAVSIDSVERLTGIDFFHLLPDHQENIIENSLCPECWSWDTRHPRK